MPELPDIELYLHALRPRVVGHVLNRVRIVSPFVVRSVDPPIDSVGGCRVGGVKRLGKRVVFGLEDDLHLVIHLMIAGRFQWRDPGAKLPRKFALAGLDFDGGTLVLTEAGTKKRASIHLVHGKASLSEHDPGGLEVLEADIESFSTLLTTRNRTLKRALTCPATFSGIGNAYSDEILHRACLSPIKLTSRLTSEETERLHQACISTLEEWTERLCAEAGEAFPKKVTAFRPQMNVHGKFGEPCPVCGSRVQRIVRAENEINYCPICQTGGKVLKDRSLSRLLRDDWPGRVENDGGSDRK